MVVYTGSVWESIWAVPGSRYGQCLVVYTGSVWETIRAVSGSFFTGSVW